MTKVIPLEGRNTVHDALKSQYKIQSVLLSIASLRDPRLKEIESLAQKKGIPVQKVSPDQIAHLSESENAQGVIAYLELPPTPTIEEIIRTNPKPFFLLFNSLDYEQNLGAILRSAWAAGVTVVIVPHTGVHEVTPVVAKVSMGGAVYVPLISQSLFQALTTLKKAAIPVIGVEVDLGEEYTKTKLTGPLALVFGSEASSLTEPLKKYCDAFVHIPMVKNVASLNVSVSAALLMFEKTRQERQI